MDGDKWIQNVSSRLIRSYLGKNDSGEKIFWDLQPETRGGIDKHLVHTGFRKVTPEELELLEGSKSDGGFKMALRNNLIVIHDEPPAGAMTAFEYLADEKAKVRDLDQKLTAAKKTITTFEVQLADQEKLLDVREKQISDFQTEVTSLKLEIANLKNQLPSALVSQVEPAAAEGTGKPKKAGKPEETAVAPAADKPTEAPAATGQNSAPAVQF